MADYEQEHVHSVYNSIASHFSATRYKGWPVVEDFLKSQRSGSVGGDIGCGNGKYLGFRKDLFLIGCDRSDELVKIACNRGFEAFVSDGLETGFKSSSLDFCISIAVIHHFSTPERRKLAIEELVRIVKSGGSVIIFVWAMEQEKTSKRTFATQDELVSWKLRTLAPDGNGHVEEKVLHRYYHLFVKGELDGLCAEIPGVEVERVGYDRDNHYVILRKL